MDNMREVWELATKDEAGNDVSVPLPVVIDAARFAENAWFICQRDEAYRHSTIGEVRSHILTLKLFLV